jgi:hypothetical protein
MCFILGRNKFKFSSDYCGSLTFKRLERVFKFDGMVCEKCWKKRERRFEIKDTLWKTGHTGCPKSD